MKLSKSLLLSLSIPALLAACGTKPPAAPAPVMEAPVAVPAPSTSAAPMAAPESTVTSVTLPDYLDPKSAISKQRSVFFDYDVFIIKSDYAGVVELQGKYLAKNPGLKVRVEGNADERGSAEYNLALGQKRSAAVVKALKVYGATDSQLEATSNGEEKPMSMGHDEAAWAQNRRADIVYPSK